MNDKLINSLLNLSKTVLIAVFVVKVTKTLDNILDTLLIVNEDKIFKEEE